MENKFYGQGQKDGGVLVLVFGEDSKLLSEGKEDYALISQFSPKTKFEQAKTINNVIDALEFEQPEVLHLLAKFDNKGKLIDIDGALLGLGDLIRRAESVGVRLFFSATENNFEEIQKELPGIKVTNFITITHRNRHYPVFLKELIEKMAGGMTFAVAYVMLAPQNENAQKNKPLPGSIALCPDNRGGQLILWANPQD